MHTSRFKTTVKYTFFLTLDDWNREQLLFFFSQYSNLIIFV